MQINPVFNPSVLKSLADHHKETFQKLGQIERALKGRFVGLDEAVDALILAAAAREPLLLIGPPGTAKSQLIRAFAKCLGIMVPERRTYRDQQGSVRHYDKRYFEYLLTPFTEPGELFGYFNIIELQKGVYKRDDTGMIQQAEIVYLDEVFNASSAILNSMLALLNEGFFHDRNNIVEAQWKLVMGATNHLPDTDALRAVFDRFLLRCVVDNVAINQGEGELRELLQKGWKETYSAKSGTTNSIEYPDLLDRLEAFRKDAGQLVERGNLKVQESSHFYRSLGMVIQYARTRYRLSEMSNRRLVKFLFVMVTHAVYQYVKTGNEKDLHLDEDELHLLWRFGLDRSDELADGQLTELFQTNEERKL